MAHLAKPLSLLFLISVSTFLHVEATERLFFSKVTHIATTSTKNAMEPIKPSETSKGTAKTTADTAAVAATTADSTVVFPYDENEIQTEKLSDENYKKEDNYNAKPTDSTVVFPYDENEIQTEELSDENYKKETTAGYADNEDNYNSGYSNNQNAYNGNGYSSKSRSGYVREKLGMSDTRFLENGKYYYNAAKSENNYYGAYGHVSGAGNGNMIEGYDNGNGENEFDSMEEYERQQGYYPRSQQEYVP